MTFRTFYVKSIRKTLKIKKIDMFLNCLKPNSKTYIPVYSTSLIFKYGWSFQDHANSRQQRIGVNVSANSIAHMLRIIKKVVCKKRHVFLAPDNHSNKEVNVDVISNVTTFVTLHFKVQTVYSFKTSYFHE